MPRPSIAPKPDREYVCPTCEMVTLRLFWRDGQWRYDFASSALSITAAEPSRAHCTWSGPWSLSEDLQDTTAYFVAAQCRCATHQVDLAKVAGQARHAGKRRRTIDSVARDQ